jgi:mannose-6-phosphate isomerase
MEIYKLQNKIKHYEWGSKDLIPAFLGVKNTEGLPCAELWMGTHGAGPSLAEGVSLREAAGGELPFLFKILAVEKPLSIQAHPDKTQAENGFLRENKAGLALDDPKRNYRDSNHKPEIIRALTPFTLMAGFREPDEILASFKTFQAAAPELKEAFSPLINALEITHGEALKSFLGALFKLPEQKRKEICSFIDKNTLPGDNKTISPRQWSLMQSFSAQYPCDASVLSPLYLNLLQLQPGQAIFVPAGVLHAYISGFGIELMSNSDNVLRGGLTPKHIDIDELMNILVFFPFMPEIITPPTSREMFSYPCPCGDFSLTALRGDGGEVSLTVSGSSICLVTEGELSCGGKCFKKGDSFFIPLTESATVIFKGNFTAFIATGRNG